MTKTDDGVIRFACRRCLTRLQAPMAKAGTRQRCPRCHLALKVPAETPAPEPREQYALREDAEPSPAADQSYLLVVCPVCRTRLYATEDQIGRQMPCPDCHTPVTVTPRPETPAKESRPSRQGGEYRLVEESDRSAAAPRATDQVYVPVVCPVCNTRMYATVEQIGHQIVCPDCHTPVTVPQPRALKTRPKPPVEAGEAYEVATDEVEVPDRRPFLAPPKWRPGFEVATRADEAGVRELARRPPGWPFFSGVFNFPLYRNSLVRWLALSLATVVPLHFAVRSVVFSGGAGFETFSGRTSVILLIMLIGPAVLFGLLWIGAASAYCLAILRDTAYGYDQVENWPDAMWLDWVGEPFYIINAVFLSVLCGLGIGWGLDSAGLPSRFSEPACFLAVFPIVLLSMLETNSPLKPWSPPVLRSLLAKWWAWGTFYVETTLVMGVIGYFVLRPVILVPVTGSIVAAAVLVAVLMIYFRVLGRLAWCCAGGVARSEVQPAAREQTDDGEQG